MKKLSICLAACALLAACAGGTRNTRSAGTYDFGLPAARLATGASWSKLALEIRAPFWFDSLSIEYRLLYDDPLQLRSYAASRWAGAPGLLLAQRLRQQLGVLSGGGRTAVSCLLRLELQEFSQFSIRPCSVVACCRERPACSTPGSRSSPSAGSASSSRRPVRMPAAVFAPSFRPATNSDGSWLAGCRN